MRILRVCLMAAMLILTSSPCKAQDVGFGTNMLYWATTTPNLLVEVGLGGHFSLSVAGGYNPFKFKSTFSDVSRSKLQHWVVYPELKYWLDKPFKGHYFGLHAFYGNYDAGGVKMLKLLDDYRYEGYGYGGGISYGYQWLLGRHWSFGASVGMGYAYVDYDKYNCGSCEEKVASGKKHYLLPTKAALSFVYYIKGSKSSRSAKPQTSYRVAKDSYPQEMEMAVIYDSEPEVMFPEPQLENVEVAEDELETQEEIDSIVSPSVPATIIRQLSLAIPSNNETREMSRIDSLFTSVSAEYNTHCVASISIKGLTSIEGTYKDNLDKSQERADKVRRYILNNYPEYENVTITTEAKGEDWDGLRNLVECSSIGDRAEILRIIDNVGIFNGREKQLMDIRGGQPYLQMKRELFPLLRRVEITVTYREKR